MQHRVFGHSTEKKHSSRNQEKKTRSSSKSRGQQRGHKGHGRTTITTLPVVPEHLDLEDHQKQRPHCHLPFKPFGTEDSDVVEVDVQAHILRYHRHRYLKTCQCEQSPAMTIAPGPAKLIRKGKLGISVWVEILLHKYAFGIPVARQLQEIDTYLTSRYTMPLSETPVLLVRLCADIARYLLMDNHVTEEVDKRYTRAVQTLRDLSTGKASLNITPTTSDAYAGIDVVKDNTDRIFTIDSLKDY